MHIKTYTYFFSFIGYKFFKTGAWNLPFLKVLRIFFYIDLRHLRDPQSMWILNFFEYLVYLYLFKKCSRFYQQKGAKSQFLIRSNFFKIKFFHQWI